MELACCPRLAGSPFLMRLVTSTSSVAFLFNRPMNRTAILPITSLRRCGDFSLQLRFSDGVEKRVNVLPLLQRGAHRRLRDPDEFARIRLDREWGTVCWSGDLDFAPEALRDLPEEPEEIVPPRRPRPGAKARRPARR